MKRFIPVFLVVTLFLPAVLAQTMRQMDLTFDIENENTVKVIMVFKFPDEIKRINVPLANGISNIETENGRCEAIFTVQQILQCEPPSPFVVGDWTLTTKFRLDGSLSKQGNITQFSFDMPILWPTDQMSITVRLPVGYTVSENVVLPVSPSGAFVLLEGRRATIRWTFDGIQGGNIIPVRVHYEAIGPLQEVFGNPVMLVIIIVLLVVGVSLVGLIYLRVNKKKKVVWSVLNENERIVVDIIQKQNEEKIDQRKIVEESSFSKAKVSRIIKSLEQRGLVEAERIGRKNRVTLKKRLLEE